VANNLSVKVTADIVDLQTKFGIARAEANALSVEFRKLSSAAALQGLDAAGTAQLSRVAQEMLVAKQRASELSTELDRTRGSTGGVGAALDDMRGKLSTAFQFTGIAAVAGAIEGITSKIMELGARAAEIRATSDVLGVSVEQYQAMKAAADEAGVPINALVLVSERLAGMLQKARDNSGEAVEELKRLGITNEQITSKTFGTNDALAVLHQKLTDAGSAATEQNRLLELFQRRGANAIEVLKLYGGGQDEVATRTKTLNGLTTDQTGAATKVYASFKALGDYLANTFTKVLSADYDAQMKRVQMMTRVASTIFASAASSPALQATIQIPAPQVASVAPQVQADAAAANAALQTVSVTAHRVTIEDLNALRDTVDSYRSGTSERLAAMKSLATAAKEFYPTDQADKYRSILKELANEEREYASAQVRAEEESSRAMEESARIRQRLISEQITANQKYLDEQSAIAREDTESATRVARMKLEAQLTELNEETDAHRLSAKQKYDTAAALTAQLAQLDKQNLQNELLSLEPGTAAYERVANQIKEIDARLYEDLASLRRKYTSETEKDSRTEVAIWQKAVGEIEGAEGTLISDLLTRRKSLSQSLLGVASQLVQQEIANDAKAITTRIALGQQGAAAQKALEQGGYLYHLLTQTSMTATDQGQNAARTAAMTTSAATQKATETTAAASSKAIQSATGTAQILSDAAVAAAGAAASVAAIPVIGWAMAPGVAAATYAEVAAYAGLASLDVGAYNIPRDMLAVVHEGEAVLPRTFADEARSSGGLAALAGGGGAAPGSSSVVHHDYGGATFNISDSGVRRMLQSRSNQRELLSFAGNMIRRGHRP
jgi:hypothetical protein